ncbi:amino acid transporter [Thiotrichales bacterium 19S9-12]|nr:amino acid transporter [Thiotrichales bacterium 19S9-11]MCF6811755.1 amino acid transporter [Thiotrichales bacterium 19S9-12]
MTRYLFSREFGGALIITGTCIGAGMLSIPLVTAASGFATSIFLLIAVWLLMTTTAFLINEVNLAYQDGTNFSNMAYYTLGRFGQFITFISFLLLLYSLSAAYTTGGASLLGLLLSYIGISLGVKLNALLFVVVLGAFVYFGTRTVDQLNKVLLVFKAITFIGLVFFIAPHLSIENLIAENKGTPYIWAAFPILLTSFGFHHILPTVRTYLKSDRKKIYRATIIGSTIPLVIYLVWNVISLGAIPLYGDHGYQQIAASGNRLDDFVSTIAVYLNVPQVTAFINAFTNIALTTSFLGVTLGLYNFNQDTYRLKTKPHSHRLFAFIITFLPAWLYAIYYPDGFKSALGYASIFVAIILVSIPALMAWKVRKSQNKLTILSRLLLILIFFSGISIILLQVATDFGWLAVLK